MTNIVLEDVGWGVIDIPCHARCGNRIVLQFGKVEKAQCCGYQYELHPTEICLFVTDADDADADLLEALRYLVREATAKRKEQRR